MSTSAWKTVYCYSAETGEYVGETFAQRSPLDDDDVYLTPAWAADEPPPQVGPRQAAVFRAEDGAVPSHCTGGEWCVLPDWRSVPLWSKTNAQPVAAQIGDTPERLQATELEPSAFCLWDGDSWEVDTATRLAALTATAEAEIASLRVAADAAIVPLQDAVDLQMATPEEEEKLTAWRRYRVELSRVRQQSGFPISVVWPPLPA
ncbi:tail fiber assembly protein [Chromobacterium sp. Beijing]|uniref:tail fiber assembly protein n=1 Tax=Chromobacterium sp. Beijing TaxID=2735795 RepID=UPI001F418FAC|nr:tail fiber assembly protein [Chromobacterium sp. Beijing]UJB30317.1 hypothetical protein HQN78_04160 [Chromobacterium sp. Beijing]